MILNYIFRISNLSYYILSMSSFLRLAENYRLVRKPLAVLTLMRSRSLVITLWYMVSERLGIGQFQGSGVITGDSPPSSI